MVISIPPGTTHGHLFYGTPCFYKLVMRLHLNQVSEEWQHIANWFFWNDQSGCWEPAGIGFSSRNLDPIETAFGYWKEKI